MFGLRWGWGYKRTTSDFLSRVWWHDKHHEGEARQEETGQNEVPQIVEHSAPDVDLKGDVDVLLGTAVVGVYVPRRRYAYTQ